MILYTNGDSHTEGGGLDDNNNIWPVLVAKQLGLPLVNEAQGGGSNDRVARMTQEFIFNQCPKLVIIGWSEVNRTELPAFNGQYMRVLPNSIMIDDHSVDVQPDLKQVLKVYYKQCHNNYLAVKRWLLQVLVLQQLFEAKGIQYIFFNAFSDNHLFDIINRNLNEIRWVLTDCYEYFQHETYQVDRALPIALNTLVQLCKQINHEHWLGFPNQTELSICKNYPVDDGGHLLDDGNIAFAQQLVKFYDSLY